MPTWTASPTKTFLNELLNLPKNISKQVPQIIEILTNDPISAQGDAKKLRQYENVYRVHVGRDYRLIYSFGQGWVKLLSIRHRSDVYKGELPDEFETPPLPNPSVLEPLLTQPTSVSVAVLPPTQLPTTVLSSSITTALPYELTQSLLKQWHIPEEYWSKLLSIQNADALLDLPIPYEFISRILDIFFPRSIEELEAQPEYLLKDSEDLDRFVEGNLIDFLLKLDPKQERLKNLESDQPILITGGPGSGKSTIALYRVQKLVELGYRSILFTTYTNTLVKYSEQLLEQLLGKPPKQAGVEVATADSIARRYYPDVYGKPTIATDNQCLGCLQRAIETTEMPANNVQQRLEELGISYLLEEILDVIEARGLTLEEYLVKRRRGRLIRLRRNIREAIWAIYQTWQQRMARNGYITWEQLRRKALEVATQLPQKPYQALIIDEAQDLSPVSLRLLLTLVPSFQNVYLTADASQSIYQRGFSWRQVHVELRVRERRIIRDNYRNTEQIAIACAKIRHSTNADEPGIDQKPSAYQGDPPTLLLVDNKKQEIQAIREFFTTAAKKFRLPLSGGAVLCRTQQVCQDITVRLTQAGMKAEFVEGKMFDLNKPYIKVLTIHFAKGLEFPFVVVVGLSENSLPFIDQYSSVKALN